MVDEITLVISHDQHAGLFEISYYNEKGKLIKRENTSKSILEVIEGATSLCSHIVLSRYVFGQGFTLVVKCRGMGIGRSFG